KTGTSTTESQTIDDRSPKQKQNQVSFSNMHAQFTKLQKTDSTIDRRDIDDRSPMQTLGKQDDQASSSSGAGNGGNSDSLFDSVVDIRPSQMEEFEFSHCICDLESAGNQAVQHLDRPFDGCNSIVALENFCLK
ncbi:UNVERIFIED_CONTAM: hypothetical protein ITH36_24595, partial [Salmonella enterica subsp. enterica serovar Weltevreden]